MAPIPTIFRRADLSANSNVAYYLLITSTVLFVVGIVSAIGLCVFRNMRRNRRLKARAEANNQTSLINEKSAFLDNEARSPRESVPEIRLTFPEDHTTHGNRQSRVVVVTIADTGSVGYAPYDEPLPVYQQKESSGFHVVDLERIGGLKEEQARWR